MLTLTANHSSDQLLYDFWLTNLTSWKIHMQNGLPTRAEILICYLLTVLQTGGPREQRKEAAK